MASEPIHINDDSELSRLFDEAGDEPVTIERKGSLFSVTRLELTVTDDHARPFDPEALQEAIQRASGMFTDEEADDMIRKIYEYRQAGSRSEFRP